METQIIDYLETKNVNVHLDMDKHFENIVNEFMISLPISYNRVNILLVMRNLYSSLLEDKTLFSKGDGKLLIEKITLNHILDYQTKIENDVLQNIKSKSYGKDILHTVSLFCKYLSRNNLVHLFYKPINFLQKSNLKKQELPLILKNFESYTQDKNYSNKNNYIKVIKAYLEFIGYDQKGNNFDYFSENQVKEYEETLRMRIVKEELSAASAYQYLKSIRLFLNYLYENKNINFKYTIPKNLINQSKRCNEFVSIKEILKLLDSVLNSSNNCLRDIGIILLLMETGCRPIEIVNLNVNDISLSERLITLRSKKSEQRKLELSHDLIKFIRSYLLIRRNYPLSNKESSFFLNINGSRITTSTIYDIVRKNNIRAFGEMKFSPKSFRHTFITNALNNKDNHLENVAKTVGHKHLSSTLYYFYRDLNTIRNIALDKKLNLKGDKI
jgi:site-specific recombinase XerD